MTLTRHPDMAPTHSPTRRRTPLLALGLAACAAFAAGCVVKETRPVPKLAAVQAKQEIPEAELLDVGVRLFDPGVPKEILDKPELGEKTGVYPDIRRAEARYLPTVLRATLEGTGQWGVVRVIPPTVDVMDVMVAGTIASSTGAHLAIDVKVTDASGATWFVKRYEMDADTGSYKENAPKGSDGRVRDPFQNLYVQVADDMLAYRARLTTAQAENLRRLSELRFAQEIAPKAFSGYAVRDPASGTWSVARLPADGDPLLARVQRIRERDDAVVDTVSDYYDSFSDKLAEPYAGWRRYTNDEIESRDELKRQARARKVLGAAAVLGGILIPDSCSSNTCDRATSVARAGAIYGGVQAVISGVQKGQEAKIHEATLKELSGSFQSEAAPQLVEVEGRALKLTGTAEEQYAEWRALLDELFTEETGGLTAAPASAADARPAPPAPAAAPAPPQR
jgi:hypothetical protein